MPWIDKPGTCEVCGKPIILKSSRHRRCSKCAEKMNRLARAQRSLERNRRQHEIRAGKDPDRWKGKDTECRVKKSCIYGSDKFCEYATIEGRSRLLAGYPIQNGRCGLYKRGAKKNTRKLELPVSAPVLTVEKLREV